MAAVSDGAEARSMQLGYGELTIQNDNGIARLILRGDFDLGNVPDLEEIVSTTLWPAYHVLVDLREVGFLDARLLRWLQRLQREIAGRGGRLLVVPSPRARRLLAAVHLADAFDLVEG